MAFRTRPFIAADAVEVWIVTEAGDWQVFDAEGPRNASRFAVRLDPPATV